MARIMSDLFGIHPMDRATRNLPSNYELDVQSLDGVGQLLAEPVREDRTHGRTWSYRIYGTRVWYRWGGMPPGQAIRMGSDTPNVEVGPDGMIRLRVDYPSLDGTVAAVERIKRPLLAEGYLNMELPTWDQQALSWLAFNAPEQYQQGWRLIHDLQAAGVRWVQGQSAREEVANGCRQPTTFEKRIGGLFGQFTQTATTWSPLGQMMRVSVWPLTPSPPPNAMSAAVGVSMAPAADVISVLTMLGWANPHAQSASDEDYAILYGDPTAGPRPEGTMRPDGTVRPDPLHPRDPPDYEDDYDRDYDDDGPEFTPAPPTVPDAPAPSGARRFTLRRKK